MQGVPSEFWWLGPALVRTPELWAEVCLRCMGAVELRPFITTSLKHPGTKPYHTNQSLLSSNLREKRCDPTPSHVQLTTHTRRIVHTTIPNMNAIRARQLLRLSAPRRNFTRTTRRNLDIEPQAPPPQEPKRPSKVGAFYKTFSAPLLKCFLGALFTYQLAYFGWMKLETIEEAHNKKTEINGLREELAGAINNKRREAEGTVEKMGDKVGEVKDKVLEGAEGAGVAGKVKKGGWWPW